MLVLNGCLLDTPLQFVTEVVSAGHSYFVGLRWLVKTRVYKLVLLHIFADFVIWGVAFQTLFTIRLNTCDERIVKRIIGMLRAQVIISTNALWP